LDEIADLLPVMRQMGSGDVLGRSTIAAQTPARHTGRSHVGSEDEEAFRRMSDDDRHGGTAALLRLFDSLPPGLASLRVLAETSAAFAAAARGNVDGELSPDAVARIVGAR
jgi:hypothetical protein